MERQILDEAREMLEAEGGLGDRRAIVLAREGWHAGVIGIVAGRLAEMFHRPAIVISLGEEISQGSARSIPGFDLYEAIKDCSDGTARLSAATPAAAGLKLRPDQLADFARRFEESCRATLQAEQLEREFSIDAEVPLGVLSFAVVDEIEKLEPHGIANPRPLLLASGLEIAGRTRAVGEQKQHLQLRLKQGPHELKAIGWNLAEKGRLSAAGHALLGGLPPVDQRMEQPPRRPARNQGYRCQRRIEICYAWIADPNPCSSFVRHLRFARAIRLRR